MYWNYRVVDMRTVENDGETYADDWLEMREVYYNEKDEPCGHCTASVLGEDINEMQEQLDRMLEASAKPILRDEDFVGTLIEDDDLDNGKEFH
jgi:hypothetical protein